MDFIDQIQNYWAIIVFVAGVIGSWVRYEMKIKDLTAEVDIIKKRNEVKDSENEKFREKILVKLEGIETSQKFILEAINKR